MRDFCAELRLVLVRTLRSAGLDAAPERISFRGADGRASFALRREEAAAPQTAFPFPLHPWLASAHCEDGRILFFPSEAFFREAAAHILREALAPLPPSIADERDYAFARMRMLARKGGTLLDASVQKAFLLALCACEGGVGNRARALRMEQAVQAALAIGRDVPAARRQAYLASCGMAAGCIARLIAPGGGRDAAAQG